MKKTLITTLMVTGALLAFSQSNTEEVDLMQAAFGMEKKALAEAFVELEGAQKDAFWAAYDEYETRRKELGRKRIDLLNRYIATYDTPGDANTDSMVKEMISLQKQTDKLIGSYYGKIKKGSGVKAAAQFYQFENYILSKIRSELMESIPFIGEFETR